MASIKSGQRKYKKICSELVHWQIDLDGSLTVGDASIHCQIKNPGFMFFHKSSSLILLYISQGEPSQCYVFDGDGVCEEFERGSSVQDCGYFTPLGYTDQWASTATASHQDPNQCPAHAATGEPSLTKVRSMNHRAHKRLPDDNKLNVRSWQHV